MSEKDMGELLNKRQILEEYDVTRTLFKRFFTKPCVSKLGRHGRGPRYFSRKRTEEIIALPEYKEHKEKVASFRCKKNKTRAERLKRVAEGSDKKIDKLRKMRYTGSGSALEELLKNGLKNN